jgi:hypothetical protein
MGKTQCYSSLEITLAPRLAGVSPGRIQKMEDYLSQYIDTSAALGSVPAALWDVRQLDLRVPPSQNQMMVANALLGLELKTKPGPRPWQTPVLELQVLKYDRKDKTCDFAAVDVTKNLPAPGEKTIRNTVNQAEVVERRKAIVNALHRTGRRISEPEKIRLEILGKSAPYIFQAMPVMARVGQYPPRGYLAV